MTAYEQIRNQFNESAACRYGEKPRLDYEPGCAFIQCERYDCKCRLNDGDGVPTTALLIEWQRRFAAI
jgi:hypothetical protein